MEYSYRGYCDICKLGSEWFESPDTAQEWREVHFESEHPVNPMRKENCRIQRRVSNAD